jgi:hypothetical protein
MDDIVKQAMSKWPNVPDVYGWLSLSRRGEWRIKGERISNPIVTDFINRNYTHDDQGRWFFQNGPQRVYVSLDYTPIVYRYADATNIETHTGLHVTHFSGAYIDDSGSILLDSEAGIGVADDRDLSRFLTLLLDAVGKQLTEAAVEKLSTLAPEHWHGLHLRLSEKIFALEMITSANIPKRFGFNPYPVQSAGEKECY